MPPATDGEPTEGDIATLRVTDSDAQATPERATTGPLPIAAGANDLGDRYVIRELIARGGMGEVHLAWDRRLQREVALKTLRTDLDDETLAPRFAFEARLSAQLEHPNIVPVHDSGIGVDGRPFYTMRWIRGHSLGQMIAEGRLPSAVERLDVFRKVCDAMAFAHAQGAIHRDLKPGNVMVGEFGEVLVLDWGIARIAGLPADRAERNAAAERLSDDMLETPQTRVGVVVGTPVFMAPEILAGQRDGLDARVDVYALGVMLYKLLTDKLPFVGDNAVRDARDGRFVSPRRRRPTIDRELDAIVCKAMAHDPAMRYASADELRRDVQAYLEGGEVVAFPRSWFGRALRWARHNRRIVAPVVATAMLATIVILVGGVRYTRALSASRDQALGAERRAQVQAAKAETASAMTWIEAGRVDEAREALRRARGALGPDEDPAFIDLTEAYLLHEWASPVLSWSSQTRGDRDQGVIVSIDGTQLLFTASDDHVRVMTVPEGMTEVDHPLGDAAVTAFGFVSNRGVIAVSQPGRAVVVDMATGREVSSVEGTEPRILSIAADGHHLEVADGAVRRVHDATSGVTRPWPLPANATIETTTADGRFASGHQTAPNRIPDAFMVWDAHTGRVLHTFDGARRVSLDPSGRWIACVTKAGTELRALDTGAVDQVWPGLDPRAVLFSADGDEVVFDEGDGELSAWSIVRHQEVARQRFRALLRGLTRDGDLVVSDGFGWSVIARSPPSAGRIQLDGDLTMAAASADGLLVCIASRDGRVRVLEPWTGAVLRTYQGAPAPTGTRNCALSPSVTRLAQADRDGVLRIWSLQDDTNLREIRGHELVHAAYFLDDDRVLASFVGGSIGVWSVTTGERLTSFESGPPSGWGVDVSRDGRWVVAGGRVPDEPIVTLWPIEGGAPKLQITDPLVGYGTRFSPDGRRVVVGTHLGLAVWWSTETGERLDAQTRYDGPVLSVAFSQDGAHVYGSSELGILTVWSASDGTEVASIPLFAGGLGQILALPGTHTLMTMGGLDQVRMFDVDRPRVVAAATLEQRPSGLVSPSPGERALQLGRLASMRGDWAAAARYFAGADSAGVRPHGIEWARAAWAAGDRATARRLLTAAVDTSEILPGSAAVWASAE